MLCESVASGGAIAYAPEDSVKIRHRGKADRLGNLGNWQGCLLEKVGGNGQTVVVEVGDGGGAELSFEAAVKIGLREV